MGIYQKPTPIVMQVGNSPQVKFMSTSDSLATITTAGYMNNNSFLGTDISASDLLLIAYDAISTVPHTGTLGWFTVSVTNGIITLAELESSTGVTAELPTVTDQVALFANTSGKIKDSTASNAVLEATSLDVQGNINAGIENGGWLASYPATSGTGYLQVEATASSGDYKVTITNADHGQQTVYTIPDCGAMAGSLAPFASTDLPMNANEIITSADTAGNLKSSGTVFLHGVTDIWGGGGTSFAFTFAGVTSAYNVVVDILTSTNSVAVAKVTPGAGTLTVEFTADPGANTQLMVIAMASL